MFLTAASSWCAYLSQFAFFRLNHRRNGMVTETFTCTAMVRCLERGTGSITILLQQPAIRLVRKMRTGLYPRSHQPLLKELGSLGSWMRLKVWVGLRPVRYQFTVSVLCGISPVRAKSIEISDDHLWLMSSWHVAWVVKWKLFPWWFVDWRHRDSV